MTNIIKEDKSVNAENFGFLLAQTNYNLSTVFRSKNTNECVADTPMTSEDRTKNKDTSISDLEESKSRNNQYQFKLLSASTNQLADLKDAEINVVASIFTVDNKIGAEAIDLTLANVPRLGNQALLSLFSSIELYIDSTLVERIDYPGLSANIDYALRYCHSKTSEKVLESNGFITQLDDAYTYENNALQTNGVYNFKNDSVSWGVVDPTTNKDWLRGIVQQRIRLRDIFPSIDTLPPIFNHSVTINFTRRSSNEIIASNTSFKDENHVVHQPYTHLDAFIDFKLTIDCHIITDELRKAAIEYYSTPKETIFTKCKQIPTGFVSKPQSNTSMTFNVAVDSAYKNKLAVFAIPRTTLLSNQPASLTFKGSYASGFGSDLSRTYDVAQAPANSFTHGGLRSFTVYTMNGVKLQSFDMSRDGSFEGIIDPYDKINMLNVKQTVNTTDRKILNYQCVYKEYLKAREQFGQIAEEGIDYINFIKEYCIFCVDLSTFTIGAGENLRVELVFEDWADDYNPYYSNNDATNGEYLSKQIYTFFYSDKILRLLPNQNVELADLFQAKTEADETNEL